MQEKRTHNGRRTKLTKDKNFNCKVSFSESMTVIWETHQNPMKAIYLMPIANNGWYNGKEHVWKKHGRRKRPF